MTPGVESETVVEARHDLFGEPVLPLWQFLRVSQDDADLHVDGYLGFAVATPGDPVDLSVYALDAEGGLGRARWRLGTQQADTLLRPQTFDGLWLDQPLGRDTHLRAWGGWARQADLLGPEDGAPMARAEVAHDGALVGARLAAQAEGDDPGLVGRQDAELRLGDATHASASGVLGVVEQASGFGVEDARVELGARVLRVARAGTWVEHRETLADTLLADRILAIYAPGGLDEAGVKARWVGARTSSLAGSVAAVRYAPLDAPELGGEAEVTWVPAPDSAAPTLGWRWATGPGGTWHAVSAVRAFPLAGGADLQARAALVPYRPDGDVWRLAATGGATVGAGVGPHGRLQLGADVTTDAVWALDTRAFAALTMGWP